MESECHCGNEESILHIYNCDLLNQGSLSNIKYENIFNGDIKDQVKVLNKFEENWKMREYLNSEKKMPCDPLVDPLFVTSSNG